MYDDDTLRLVRETRAMEARNKRHDLGDPTTMTVDELLTVEHPKLTSRQRAVLKEKVEAAVGSARNVGWLRFKLDSLIGADPDLVRPVPSVAALFEALDGPSKPPAARIELNRQLQKLAGDDDALLAALPPSAEAPSPTAIKADDKPTPPAKTFATMTDDELDGVMAERRGLTLAAYRYQTFASEIQKFRAALKSSVPMQASTSAADVLKAKGAKDWSAVKDPQTRIALHRQHVRETGGK